MIRSHETSRWILVLWALTQGCASSSDSTNPPKETSGGPAEGANGANAANPANGDPGNPAAATLQQSCAAKSGSTIELDGHTWRATQDVPPGICPLGVGDGSATDRARLLAQRVGFGRNAGTAGQDLSGAPTVVVNNANDSGAGSLRAALAIPGPKWIVFAGNFDISVASTLVIPSDTVIDGRGHAIVLNGPGSSQRNMDIVDIVGAQNVILENLTVQKTGPLGTLSNPLGDDVHIGGSHDVWVDHLTLAESGDKELVTEDGTFDTTGSWNHFVGGSGDDPGGEQMWGAGNQTNGAREQSQTITSHHNFFDGLVHATAAPDGKLLSRGYRMPEFSYGKLLHKFNDVAEGWVAYGVYCKRSAGCWIDDNVFAADPSPDGDKDAVLYDPADRGSDACKAVPEGVYADINTPYSGSNVSGLVDVYASVGRNRFATSVTTVDFTVENASGSAVEFLANGARVTNLAFDHEPYAWTWDTKSLADAAGYTLHAHVTGVATGGGPTANDAAATKVGIYNHGTVPPNDYDTKGGCNVDGRPGYVNIVGNTNLLLAGARTLSNEPSRVPDPSTFYAYAPEPADAALKAKVSAFAGANVSPWVLVEP